MTAQDRTAEEVCDDHLHEGQQGSIEADLARNDAEDVVLLCTRGVLRGHDGVRQANRWLMQELPEAGFAYQTRLEWPGQVEDGKRARGADSLLIRDGRIVAQTGSCSVKEGG